MVSSGCQGAGSRRCLPAEEEKSPPGEDSPAGGGTGGLEQEEQEDLEAILAGGAGEDRVVLVCPITQWHPYRPAAVQSNLI